MLFDLTLFFKIVVGILIIISLFFLLKQVCRCRLSSIIINVIVLIILIVLFFVPNYMKKLPIQAKEVAKISDEGLINSKILIVATEGTYCPWNYVSACGRPEGFDTDIAREIAKRMHLKPEFIIGPFQSLLTNLSNRQYDLVIAAISVMPNRKEKVDFSIPYAQVKVTFFSKNSVYNKYINADLDTLKKVLKGKTVGTQVGTSWPVYLNNEFKDIVKIKYYNTQPQLMMEVESGRVDVGFSEVPSVVKFMKDHKDIVMFGPKLGIKDSKHFGEGIAIAIPKGNKALLQKVNDALKSMQEDGTIKVLSIKYFDDDISYYEDKNE